MTPAEYDARKERIVEQHYSPETGETLTVLDDTPAHEAMAWIAAHRDSVLVFARVAFVRYDTNPERKKGPPSHN
jgi:hypothetical protein